MNECAQLPDGLFQSSMEDGGVMMKVGEEKERVLMVF